MTTLQVFAVLLFLFIVVKDNRIPKRIDTTSTKVERSDNKFSLYSVSRNHYTVKQFLGPLKQKKEVECVDFVPFFLDIKLFIEFLVVPDTSTQGERGEECCNMGSHRYVTKIGGQTIYLSFLFPSAPQYRPCLGVNHCDGGAICKGGNVGATGVVAAANVASHPQRYKSKLISNS